MVIAVDQSGLSCVSIIEFTQWKGFRGYRCLM